MLIFIIGFMASGKSYWARRLAEKTGTQSIDLDQLIEKKEKMSLDDLIQRKGWDYFRQKEQEILKKIQKKNITFIAVGGGTPCYFDNLIWMQSQGKVIYLKTPVELLLRRLQSDPNQRPLLRGKTSEQLAAFVANLLSEREEYYQKADFIVSQNTDNQAVENIILSYLKIT